MVSKDSSSMDSCVKRSFFLFCFDGLSLLASNLNNLTLGESWESLGLMGNIDSSIASTFQNSENLGTSGGSIDTNIEECLEWSLLINIIINIEVVTTDVLISAVHFSESHLFKKSSSQ
jgi:hypothetical protein